MIFVLIGLVCLAIAVTLTIIDKVGYLPDWLQVIGFVSWIIAIVIAVFFIFGNIAAIGEHDSLEQEYKELCLLKQASCNETDPVTIYVINQRFTEWNEDLKSFKYTGNNPWTSWFWLADTAEDVNYIELLE